jgi:hypothetical protein
VQNAANGSFPPLAPDAALTTNVVEGLKTDNLLATIAQWLRVVCSDIIVLFLIGHLLYVKSGDNVSSTKRNWQG